MHKHPTKLSSMLQRDALARLGLNAAALEALGLGAGLDSNQVGVPHTTTFPTETRTTNSHTSRAHHPFTPSKHTRIHTTRRHHALAPHISCQILKTFGRRHATDW